jgi:hypothetical protein
MPSERAADTLGAMTALILLDAAGRRRSPATVPVTTADARLATRVCGIRLTRRRSRRSSL